MYPRPLSIREPVFRLDDRVKTKLNPLQCQWRPPGRHIKTPCGATPSLMEGDWVVVGIVNRCAVAYDYGLRYRIRSTVDTIIQFNVCPYCLEAL